MINNDRVFVPPIKTQGIKTKLVPLIKQNIALRDGAVWIEPFMGSGVVGFNVEPERAVFADINPHIVAFYDQLKSGVIDPGMVRVYLEHEGGMLAQGGEEYYYTVRERFNKERNPLDFLFLNRACFNGMIRFNRHYEYNVPFGHKPNRFSKAYITKIVNQVAHVWDLLQRHSWTFLCQSFEDTISMAGENDFIYCDPPYIGRHVDYYDSWDEGAEVALHSMLVGSKADFMLSTWDHNDYRRNDYISSVWPECRKITINHFYHVGAKEANRNAVVEALLMNYSAGKERHGDEQLSLFDIAQ